MQVSGNQIQEMETLEDILKEFKDKFPPTNQLSKKVVLFTTDSIFKSIQNFHPGLIIMMDDLCDELKKMGYQYEMGVIANIPVFRWKTEDRYDLIKENPTTLETD